MPITPFRLCGETKELQESHILPGFVYRWLKETSATGYLRFHVIRGKQRGRVTRLLG